MPSTGRGGAGNIQAISAENARVSADLEANQQSAESDHKGPLPSDYLERDEQQYAHTGRGGAGNYYSPKELSQTGNFSGAGSSHILGEGTVPPASSSSGRRGSAVGNGSSAQPAQEPMRTYGRGGAGNYAYGVSESEERAARKRMEDEQKREQLKADIEKGVKENLAMPQKAKLPGGEPF